VTTTPTRRRLNRAEKRAANRTRLLEAAVRVFAERGYQAASVQEIAEESGLSNGALYYNFDSKQQLFLALMDDRTAARIAELEATFGPTAASGSGTEHDIRRLTGRDSSAAGERREWTLLFEFLAHSTRDPLFRRRFRARVHSMRRALAVAVGRRAGEEGTRLTLPVEQAAAAIQALGWGVAAQRLADPAGLPDDFLGTLVIALLKGLTQDQAAA